MEIARFPNVVDTSPIAEFICDDQNAFEDDESSPSFRIINNNFGDAYLRRIAKLALLEQNGAPQALIQNEVKLVREKLQNVKRIARSIANHPKDWSVLRDWIALGQLSSHPQAEKQRLKKNSAFRENQPGFILDAISDAGAFVSKIKDGKLSDADWDALLHLGAETNKAQNRKLKNFVEANWADLVKEVQDYFVAQMPDQEAMVRRRIEERLQHTHILLLDFLHNLTTRLDESDEDFSIVMGDCDPFQRRIAIASHLKGDQLKIIFRHELLHLISAFLCDVILHENEDESLESVPQSYSEFLEQLNDGDISLLDVTKDFKRRGLRATGKDFGWLNEGYTEKVNKTIGVGDGAGSIIPPHWAYGEEMDLVSFLEQDRFTARALPVAYLELENDNAGWEGLQRTAGSAFGPRALDNLDAVVKKHGVPSALEIVRGFHGERSQLASFLAERAS